ncbi:protein of unknown function [Flavobacteriaceae bacterium MAR_2010_188]|nr:protein of unknown function [Flavobacteriaceae bacterium MAR_2010_188]
MKTFNLKSYSWIFLSFLLVCFTSCKSKVDSLASQTEITALKNVVDSKNYEIVSDVAYPRATSAMMNIQNSGLFGMGNTANRISLIGNSNFLKVNGDSISSQLPYFGERQMAASYDPDDIGINLKGVLEDYSAEWNERKQMYLVNFKARSNREFFDVYINFYPNMTCRMTITGNTRFPIGYSGNLQKIDISEE